MFSPNRIDPSQGLPDSEVHLWLVDLQISPEARESYRSLLSPVEIARVDAMRHPPTQRQRTIAWAVRRQLVGEYLKKDAQTISFPPDRNGKPFITSPDASDENLTLNLSYCEKWVLLGFKRDGRVGVDIECEREIDFDALVRTHFSISERTRWSSLRTEQDRRLAFYQAWTRKEAYLKACGDGLLRPLASFDVAFLPEEPAAILHCNSDANARNRWHVASFHLGEDTTACVIAEAPVMTVKTSLYSVR